MMLPHVVRFNANDAEARAGYEALGCSVEELVSRLNQALSACEMPSSLRKCGVTADAVPMLSEEAASQWTARFNPREIGASDFEALYSAAL
jgi:alcohol dehydrogenase